MRKQPFFTHLRLRREELEEDKYPLSIPAVAQMDNLRFHPAVTVFAGENGSGKSTLIEAIAVAAGFSPEGGRKSYFRETVPADETLAASISLARQPEREQDGYFLRSESAYLLMTYLNETGYAHHYGGDLHLRSHGEAFMAIFQNRFQATRNALFILDEIESALSPQRQLEFLALMHEHVKRGSMFIVSTHSVILMSYPQSRLYWLSGEGIEERNWKDTNHFHVYQGFCNRPQIVHDTLFGDELGVKEKRKRKS
jgi:predicted ATPase